MRQVQDNLNRLISALLVLLVGAALAATVGPLFLPYRTYAVLSGSMAPGIPVGALVIDRPASPRQLRPGDVVTFGRPDRPGELVTHRITQIEPTGPTGISYRTKGDANNSPDPWLVAAAATNWRVAATLPLVGYALGFLRTPIGQLLTLVLPGFVLGFALLRDLWRQPAQRPATAGR